jgi:hypothetical protein
VVACFLVQSTCMEARARRCMAAIEREPHTYIRKEAIYHACKDDIMVRWYIWSLGFLL